MDLNNLITSTIGMSYMKNTILRAAVILVIFICSSATAAPEFSFSPTPQISTTATILTIRSGWRERIKIFPGDPGFDANIIVNGNIVNLDVVGGNGVIFFPDIFTHVVRLGQFAPGTYQLRLRYRSLPTEPGVPGLLNPNIAATSNFTVEQGPVLATQVPTLSSGTSILLSLLVLGCGVFAVRRR
jgi:hypothetical protein